MIVATRALIGGAAALALVVLTVSGAMLRFDLRQSQLFGRQIGAPAKTTDLVPRRIVDPQDELYAAIGRFEGTMACTATVIADPRIIITAAHCVTERYGSIRRARLSFRLGYQAGHDLGRFEARLWAVGSKQSFRGQSVHDAAEDWAILVLHPAPAWVRPLSVNYGSFEILSSLGRTLVMPGYSNDVADAQVLSVAQGCSVRELAWGVMIHDCRASFGSSGAPLLVQDGLQYAVIGIHTGSMFASDPESQVARFVGHRVIGSWAFRSALLTLSRSLNSGEVADMDTGH